MSLIPDQVWQLGRVGTLFVPTVREYGGQRCAFVHPTIEIDFDEDFDFDYIREDYTLKIAVNLT